MTTSPRFWTDLLAGLTYAKGQKLPSTHMNNYVAGMRVSDLAHETKIALNWIYTDTDADWQSTSCACWLPDSYVWLVGRQAASAANPDVLRGSDIYSLVTVGTPPPAGDGLTVKDMAAHANLAIMCGDPGASSNKKYRYSTGGDVWAIGTSTVTDATSVNAICYHSVAVGFVSGAEGGIVEHSTDGATWTAGTPANSNAISAIASNGTTIVAVSSATTDKCVTSTDGSAWVERTMATSAAWYDVCWVPQQSMWVAVGIAGGMLAMNKSTNGTTWSAITIGGLSGGMTPRDLVSTGNLLVFTADHGVYVSADLGTTWRTASELPGLASVQAMATAVDLNGIVSQVMLAGPDGGTANTLYAATLIGN